MFQTRLCVCFWIKYWWVHERNNSNITQMRRRMNIKMNKKNEALFFLKFFKSPSLFRCSILFTIFTGCFQSTALSMVLWALSEYRILHRVPNGQNRMNLLSNQWYTLCMMTSRCTCWFWLTFFSSVHSVAVAVAVVVVLFLPFRFACFRLLCHMILTFCPFSENSHLDFVVFLIAPTKHDAVSNERETSR